MITTLAQAIVEFSRLCPPFVCPELSTNQNAVNEKQQIEITGGTPTSGAMALTLVNPVTLISGTTSITWNSSAAAAQTALESLPNVAIVDVACTGGPLPGTPIAIQFGGEYAGIDVALMTATDTFDAGSVTVSVLIAGLPVGEVPTILARHKRAELWSAATVYQLGAAVIPTVANRNGRRYGLTRFTDVATDQQTGTTEPSWPDGREAQVTDGHVVWEEAGNDYGGVLWDFTAAARDGWSLKASKATPGVDFQDAAGLAIKGGQLYDHCIEQSNRFVPAYVL